MKRGGELRITVVSITTPNGMVADALIRRPSARRLAPGEAKPSLEIAVGTAITGSRFRNAMYLPTSIATPPPTATIAWVPRGRWNALATMSVTSLPCDCLLGEHGDLRRRQRVSVRSARPDPRCRPRRSG